MAERIRAFDWVQHPLGPAQTWPQSLKSAVSICLGSRFPILIWWGPQLFMLYNDAYRPMLGTTKHPGALGQAGRGCWPEIWHIIGPMLEDTVLRQGQATWSDDQLLLLDRNGYLEECYFTFTYSPIRVESGDVGGVFCAVIETTLRVIGERRLRLLKELATRTMHANSDIEACRLSAEVIGPFGADLPFVRLYRVDGSAVKLVAGAGEADERHTWPNEVPLGRESALLDGFPPGRALLMPLAAAGSEAPAGYMVAGISPRRALDDDYRSFIALVAGHIASAIADARALEAERQRLAALAELDRAKTAFFSNVSHEFRTPLTLILGPVEDARRSADRELAGEPLESVYRNALRLQKLVNALLDFSRIEAGRFQATFEPTDLASITTGIAGAFRSAMHCAGLSFEVECELLPEPVFVDRSMWETIVLNLLSNAFKFTIEGSVHVGLSARDRHVELTVRDTGSGIAPEHLPHLFERFYRVKESRARTFEGSGIGLALVQELVRMHGGSIDVDSRPGEGTVFRVTIPFGSLHLPPDRIRDSHAQPTAASAGAYVEEALRWLPTRDTGGFDEPMSASDRRSSSLAHDRAHILLVDDNADMREYVRGLLAERWEVTTATNGADALQKALRRAPDLVLTDVMMPEMDGFELIRAVRADERLRQVPIVILTARTGEEARIEGLSSAADDYLAKPFSARELTARVEAQLTRAWLRRLERAHYERLLETFRHAPVAIAIFRGPEHIYEFANDQYLQLIGRRSVLGQPIRLALAELAEQGIFGLLGRVYTSGEPYRAEMLRTMIRREGDGALEERFFDVSLHPSRDERGVVSGVVLTATEITDLANARREAEAANRAKDEFLAMLGHELRNPLAPILTALQLMRLRDSGAERERAIIERQVTHVVRLVDDLLDVSRITRGKLVLQKQRVGLAAITAKAIEMASPLIEQRHHLLAVDVPREGCDVFGDPARLAQIIANLLTNAAKYTEPGGRIWVSAVAEEDHVTLAIRDSGLGIAPEALSTIFDLFAQGRQPLDRAQGGLGLGLAIVKSLVDLHGGTVWARSDGPGTGSEFLVRLPLARVPVAAEVRADAGTTVPLGPSGWRVLVVDDNDDAAAMLREALEQCGHQARTAREGISALSVAEAFEPHVALLDIGLPVMDGYELARRFRAHPRLEATRLVAVTGYGQESDRNLAEAAGFDAHLVKPVDLDELIGLIDALARGSSGPQEMVDAQPST